MELSAEVMEDLQKRLRRVEGQVRGIQQMLTEGRDCRDIVAQISAVGTAVERVGFKLLVTGMSQCLADPKAAKRNGFDLDEVEALFLKLA